MSFRNRIKKEKIILAKQMRDAPTKSEAIIWSELSNKKLGVKFRRQAIILGYIVDFYCPSKKVVIELDGKIHADRVQYDALRDKRIKTLNFRILRIQSRRIFTELDKVLEEIKNFTFVKV